MIRFKRWAAPVALFVVLGAAPALANEGEGPLPEQALLEYGLSAEDIDYLLGEGLGYAHIYILQTAAQRFNIEATILYQGVDGKISWGKLMKAFDANFGAFLSAYQASH
jgi:hypothetical protein